MATLRVVALALLAICAVAPSAQSAAVSDKVKPILRAAGDLCMHVFDRRWNFKNPELWFQDFFVSDYTKVAMQSLQVNMGQSLSYMPYVELEQIGRLVNAYFDRLGNNSEAVSVGETYTLWTDYFAFYYMSDVSCKNPFFPNDYFGPSKPIYHAAADLCDFILNPKRFDPAVFAFSDDMNMHDVKMALFNKAIAYMNANSIPVGPRAKIDPLLQRKDLDYTFSQLRIALAEVFTNFPDPNNRGYGCWQPVIDDKFLPLIIAISGGNMNKAALAAAAAPLFGLLRH